ncbi:MAG: ABC transporter ATP-binding protein [Acidobacteriales bacterium]|nr:ABC transporter ATP-binding protein [Terriglobales bacterium]
MQIRIDSLSKKFGPLHALENINLTIGSGQLIVILGANGAGKTTLLRCLSAMVVPSSGTIHFDDQLFQRGRMDLRQRLLFLPDFPFVFPDLTVLRHLSMVLSLFGRDGVGNEDLAIDHLRALDMLPLAKSKLGILSRGQLYKAALAGLLLVDPELWLLDEPFASGMDPNGIAYFKEQARAAAARGRTVLYTTQILDVAENFSDRVALVDHGRLLHFESVAGLREKENVEEGVLEKIFRDLRGRNA